MQRLLPRSCLAALLGLLALAAPVVASAQDPAGMSRTPVQQPTLKQSSAPQARSAQGDCVREANRRGYTVLDTFNFQQMKDGWTIDMRVRNQRGQVSNGSCFVATRTGDVNLYGFGWGWTDEGDERMQFNCASVDMKYRECQLPIRGRAVLVKRLSDARCVEGQSWGQRNDRVWVDHGCRAKFEVTRTGGGGSGGSSNLIDCNSDGGRYRECPIGSGYFGRLVRDNSGGRCRQNATWGTRNGVIWVTEGCRGRFEKVRGNSGGAGGSAQVRAEQACVREVENRGGRVLEQQAAYPHNNGYRMQLRVRTYSNDTRLVQCTYSSSGQVRLEGM